MTVDVDDAGGDEIAGAVDLQRPRWGLQSWAAARVDDAVAEDDRAVVEAPAVAVEHGRMADDGEHARVALVGRGIGILVDPDRRGELFGRLQRRARAKRERGGGNCD